MDLFLTQTISSPPSSPPSVLKSPSLSLPLSPFSPPGISSSLPLLSLSPFFCSCTSPNAPLHLLLPCQPFHLSSPMLVLQPATRSARGIHCRIRSLTCLMRKYARYLGDYGVKKSEMENLQKQHTANPRLRDHRTNFTPTLHHADQPSRIDYNIPKENNDFLRHRCTPRKRRVLQQPYLQHQNQHQSQGQPWPDWSPNTLNPAQSKLLASKICVSTSENTSPSVSPKTLIPLSYPPQFPPTSPSTLRPCHICHRRPTTREVLDAYADCDLCGQRSCYICLRQCDSPNCCGLVSLGSHLLRDGSDRLQEEINGDDTETRHARKICSCCAVEGVTEAGVEVVQCLDCVRAQLSPCEAEPPDQVGCVE